MMRFSEFYGPERQQELLQEAEKQRLIQEILASGQHRSLLQILGQTLYRTLAEESTRKLKVNKLLRINQAKNF